MEYKRMKDEQNILSSPSPEHHHDPDCHHHHHHRHHRRHFLFIFSVMTFVVVISYIIVVGASFGIHQKNALLHHNYIANSSIIINIIVNGQNKSLSDDEDAIIFKIIGEVIDDNDIIDGDEIDEPERSNEDEEDEGEAQSQSQSYEKIDKSIPIARGPLRIERPAKIPVLN